MATSADIEWFPRMAVYNDVRGWQNKAFAGREIHALELGDYKVEITVPLPDHVVGATGELQNPGSVLSKTQRKRMKQAIKSLEPVFIVNQEEAESASGGTNKAQSLGV